MIWSINKQLVTFFVLTFLMSWPLWYFSGVLTRGSEFIYDWRWLISQCGVFAPSLAALIVSGTQSKSLRRNGALVLTLFVALLIGGTMIARSFARSLHEFRYETSLTVMILGLVSVLFYSSLNRRFRIPGTGELQKKISGMWISLSILSAPLLFMACWGIIGLQLHEWTIASITNNAKSFIAIVLLASALNLTFGGPMGEELGWRGFALPQLLKKFSPVRASLILGFIWAFWHLPIDVYNGSIPAVAAIVFRFIWTIPLTIIFTWFFLQTQGNMLIPILLHTSINVLPDLGFSHYESSILLLTLGFIVAAAILTRTTIMRTGIPLRDKNND